jgi:hypothetical protein
MTHLRRLAMTAAAFACGAFAWENSAYARGCTEVSDIVGYEKCHRFGDGWAVERRWPIAVGLTLPYQTFDPNGVNFDFATGKNDPKAFTLPGERLGSNGLGAFGFNLRIEGFIFSWLYLGVEYGIGFGHNQIGNFVAPVGGVPTQFSGSDAAVNSMMLRGGAFAGLRIPLGRVSLRLEGFAGGSSMTVDLHSPVADYTANSARGLLMPRAVLDVWASPNVTMSAFGGVDTLDTHDRIVGVMLEFHARSFDGAFSFW